MDYTQKSKQVAEELIGMRLETPSGLVAEIIETEAYEGGNQTNRRYCMRLAPGQVGVMPFRGLNFLNIGTEEAGTPSCVLIRSVKVDNELVEGPGRVGKRLDAKSLEFLVAGKDIKLTGKTKPSEYFAAEGQSDNSLGRYRLK